MDKKRFLERLDELGLDKSRCGWCDVDEWVTR